MAVKTSEEWFRQAKYDYDTAFVDNLNDLSVPTRYPDEIQKLVRQYSKKKTADILESTRKGLLWLKEKI